MSNLKIRLLFSSFFFIFGLFIFASILPTEAFALPTAQFSSINAGRYTVSTSGQGVYSIQIWVRYITGAREPLGLECVNTTSCTRYFYPSTGTTQVYIYVKDQNGSCSGNQFWDLADQPCGTRSAVKIDTPTGTGDCATTFPCSYITSPASNSSYVLGNTITFSTLSSANRNRLCSGINNGDSDNCNTVSNTSISPPFQVVALQRARANLTAAQLNIPSNWTTIGINSSCGTTASNNCGPTNFTWTPTSADVGDWIVATFAIANIGQKCSGNGYKTTNNDDSPIYIHPINDSLSVPMKAPVSCSSSTNSIRTIRVVLPAPPPQPTVTTTAGNNCLPGPVTGTNDITISWTNNATPVTWVDISTTSNFSSYYHKAVTGTANTATSTTAPAGFNGFVGVSGALTLQPNTTYYVRLYNGTNGAARSFNYPVCGPLTLPASCSVSPSPANTDQIVTWSVTPVGGAGVYTYSWSGTDGLIGTTQSVQKQYSTTGSKNATVTVTSGAENKFTSCSVNITLPPAGPPGSFTISASPNSICDASGGPPYVDLTWTQSANVSPAGDPGGDRYDIYRTTDPSDNLNWSLIGSQYAPGILTYRDTTVTSTAGVTYYYYVKAINSLGWINSSAVTTLTIDCTPFDYSLSVTTNPVNVTQGAAASNSVLVNYISGPTQPVTVSFPSNFPTGTTYTTINNPCTPPALPPSRVFVTSNSSYTGNLGGVAGADTKCQASANTAGLGGTWKAWISDWGPQSASVRLIHSTSQYRLLNSTVVANNWTDLTDGSLPSPINIQENGAAASGNMEVWTNTTADGSTFSSGASCNIWQDGSGASFGSTGLASATNSTWTLNNPNLLCADFNFARLYCIEQVSVNTSCTVPVTIQTAGGASPTPLGSYLILVTGQPLNKTTTFTLNVNAQGTQWIQTTSGDVHSNTNIDTPGGP